LKNNFAGIKKWLKSVGIKFNKGLMVQKITPSMLNNCYNSLIIKRNIYKLIILIYLFIICFYTTACNKTSLAKNDFKLQQSIKNYKNSYLTTPDNTFFVAGRMHKKSTSLKLLLLDDGNVVISGGDTREEINDFEIFDPSNGQYKIITLPSKFKQPRNSIILNENNILINDSFIYNYKTGDYVNIFNKDDYTNYSTSFIYSPYEIFILEKDTKCYIYDFKNNLLKKVEIKFPFKLAGKTFIKMDNDNVVIYGIHGFKDKPGAYFTTDLYLWNLKHNVFTQLNSDGISDLASIVKLNNDEVIIFGEKFYNQDENNIGEKKQETYKLNVKTNKLVKLKNSIIERTSSPIAIALSNNKVFLIGGESYKEKGKMTAELYNIAEDKYFKLASTSSTYIPANPFRKLALLELSNKDILLCGGVQEGIIQDKCLIYKMEK